MDELCTITCIHLTYYNVQCGDIKETFPICFSIVNVIVSKYISFSRLVQLYKTHSFDLAFGRFQLHIT